MTESLSSDAGLGFERRWGESRLTQLVGDYEYPEELTKGSITTIHLPCDNLRPNSHSDDEAHAQRSSDVAAMSVEVIEQVLDYG